MVSTVAMRLAQHTRFNDLANECQIFTDDWEELGSGPLPVRMRAVSYLLLSCFAIMTMVDTSNRRTLF
jgi:hypothetical protein